MTTTRKKTNEARMAAALRPFGWTCGPDFWRRYYADPWVFNLANAVEHLSTMNAVQIDGSGDGPDA